MNAVAEIPRARTALLAVIDKHADTITSYLPNRETRERFLALAKRAVIDNPDVWECTPVSVLKSLGAAAASGLPIDGKMSSLVVRKMKDGSKVCVWDPSYRGMVYLALESGHVASVEAHAVYEHDEFHVELGTSPQIVHRPHLGEKRGPVIAAYAYAVLKTAAVVRVILGRDDLNRIRDTSPAAEKGPWASWPDRMAAKSAVRRLLKMLPAADVGSLARAMDHLAEVDDDPGVYAVRAGGPPPAEVVDTTGLEARAMEAIGSAETVEQLAALWVGVRAEFQRARADVPLQLEARYNDRREALQEA